MRKLLAALAAIAVAAGCLWYLSAPPKGIDSYRERAASTLESLHSQVQVARIWSETVSEGRATTQAALVGLQEAERDASSAASQFERHEPPFGGLELRTRLSALATKTTTALGDLRIAAEQERWDEVPRLTQPLRELAPRLEDFETEAMP